MMLFFDSLSMGGGCDSRWLEQYDGKSRHSPHIGTPSDVYTTIGCYLTIYLRDNWSNVQPDFVIWITSYHSGACRSEGFKCENGRCIDNNLRCFGENPCGDKSECHSGLSKAAIAGICVDAFSFAAVVTAVVISCDYRRHKSKRLNQSLITPQSNLVSPTTVSPVYGYDRPVPKLTAVSSYPGLATMVHVQNQ